MRAARGNVHLPRDRHPCTTVDFNREDPRQVAIFIQANANSASNISSMSSGPFSGGPEGIHLLLGSLRSALACSNTCAHSRDLAFVFVERVAELRRLPLARLEDRDHSRVRTGVTVNDPSITRLHGTGNIGQRKGRARRQAERALSLPTRMHGRDRRRDTRRTSGDCRASSRRAA